MHRSAKSSRARRRGARGRSPWTVYLIHLERPYRHARHYLGSTNDLPRRLRDHAAGSGSRFMEVVSDAGIAWSCVRTWPGGRTRERELKRRGGAARICPVCSGQLEFFDRNYRRRREAAAA